MAYLLDSDVLIQAKNMHYGFDFCPAFWDWLLEANAAERVFSVQKVAEELRDGGDELAEWVKQRDTAFFLEPDDKVVASLGTTSRWATNAPLYERAAVNAFLRTADYFLVAHATPTGTSSSRTRPAGPIRGRSSKSRTYASACKCGPSIRSRCCAPKAPSS
jgi:hypothetical protein